MTMTPRHTMPTVFVAALATMMTLPAPADAETVATVAGKAITLEELEKRVRPQLIEIENSRYEVLESGLDEMVAERLMEKEAAERGATIEKLVEDEINARIADPTEAEIEAVYEMSKENLDGASLDDVRQQIVVYLSSQKAAALGSEFLAGLREKYDTKILLEPPVVDVANGLNPARGGGKDAPVTIVAFSDYECPYCKQAEQVVERVLDAYGDKVRYFHRDFPLPFHANAHQAAQAARCAGDQSRFWDYNVTLFATPTLSTEKLQEIADGMQLDRSEFDECLASEKYKDAVDADLAAGEAIGVNGTPAFFINGRAMSGALPMEKFRTVIDAELAREATTAAN